MYKTDDLSGLSSCLNKIDGKCKNCVLLLKHFSQQFSSFRLKKSHPTYLLQKHEVCHMKLVVLLKKSTFFNYKPLVFN